MIEEFKTEELVKRWIHMLRMKASEYEHVARHRGIVVASPSIDDICNEITAYFTGIVK